ncbi:hypothetical protein [Clostridium cibarium]|uniref:Uncharacterized protein n=1 Tax=Clostridium cibarium TaxID=2762247 RepID=A0ABR8PX60_9CLOT|nr:hypothetical protein [Clostridium cibarium]MBD7912762.1 hypothetical protein [Clostridium cibarium]
MIIYSVVVLVTLARILNNKRHARKDECKFNSYEVALDALNVTIWECYENKFFVSNKLRDILHTNREIKCFQDFYFFICRRMQNIYKVFFTI